MGCGTSKPPASAELADNAKPDDTEAALPADQQRSDAPEDPFAPTLSDAEKRLVDVQPRLESAEVVDPAFRTNWAEGIPPPTAGPDPTASALVRGLASISNTTPSYARLKRLHDNVLALLIFALDIRLCVEVLFEGSGDFAFDTICALLLGATLQWWWTGEYMGSWTTLGYTTGWEMVGQVRARRGRARAAGARARACARGGGGCSATWARPRTARAAGTRAAPVAPCGHVGAAG